MSDFEDRLRAIAKEISGAVERNIDDVAETFGVDGHGPANSPRPPGNGSTTRSRAGEELFGRQRRRAGADAGREDGPPSRFEPAPRPSAGPGPHPLDMPTDAQGLALSALDSGRWTVRPGSNMLGEHRRWTRPVDAAEIVVELRRRDWIKATAS